MSGVYSNHELTPPLPSLPRREAGRHLLGQQQQSLLAGQREEAAPQ